MRVLEVFGGQSAEHDVSVASGWAVARGLREAGHQVTTAHIDRRGRWRAIVLDGAMPAVPQPLGWPDADPWALLTSGDARPDVVMAVLHGPRGEDGVIVALAQLADVACVGAGLASSAVCLDKTLTRDVLDARGIAQTRWLGSYPGDPALSYDDAVDQLGSTVLYVKPANLGSSIGISRVVDAAGWDAAVSEAAGYDDTLIVEAGVAGRELSVSILGNRSDGYDVSEVSETRPHGEFLDHADKYGAGAAMAQVPADLAPALRDRVRGFAPEVAAALRVDGLARVDVFLTEDGALLVNEVNTMPGFTTESTFPRMWAASGVSFPQVLDRLCDLAVRRHGRSKTLVEAGIDSDDGVTGSAASSRTGPDGDAGPSTGNEAGSVMASEPSTVPIRVRVATDADWQVIGELTIAAYTAILGRPPLAEYDSELADVAARAQECTLLVAEDADGRVVGAVGYDRMPGTNGKAGRARQVSVSPDLGGRGIGRALVEEVMARLRAEGVTEMAERTADYMAGAQALYLSLGFRRAPERDEQQDDGPDLLGFHRYL